MSSKPLSIRLQTQIDDAVKLYVEHRPEYVNVANRLLEHLTSNADFKRLIHSFKSRDKDPGHLRDKLERQARKARDEKKKFNVDATNVFDRIEDLAGVRLLHLHSKQIRDIHPKLLQVLEKYQYRIVHNPEASTWDIENTALFSSLGFTIINRDSLYTSVHYVVQPHYGTEKCEIQVRTLAEELWGEVSHAVNYPKPTRSLACQEQILALARLTSAASRLVDAVITSRAEFDLLSPEPPPAEPAAQPTPVLPAP